MTVSRTVASWILLFYSILLYILMKLLLVLLVAVGGLPVKELIRVVYQKREKMVEQQNRSLHAEKVF